MEPTKKSPAIESLLTNASGISRQEASAKKICTWCKQPLSEFRDYLSKKEYGISGFCQSCQDQVFGGSDARKHRRQESSCLSCSCQEARLHLETGTGPEEAVSSYLR